jgi:hypothetical protein
MKIKKILTTLVIASVVLIAACKKDNFEEIVGVCPLVVATSPVANATAVSTGKVVTVTFNERMDPATINKATFTLKGATRVEGTVTYDDFTKTMSFTPTVDLVENTTYTGRVLTYIKDLDGNALQADFVWAFSTGSTIIPIVVSTNPLQNETGVAINREVLATFNMPMDALTFTDSTFKVQHNGNPVNGNISYVDSTVTFTPTVNLLPNSTYTCILKGSIKNTLGTSLGSDYIWTFTTAANIAPTVISTDPINNATGVALNKLIKATFSIKMDPSTINGSTYTLRAGANAVAGVISYTDSTATFTPTGGLLSNTVYTATITTGAKNLAGTSLVNNKVWTFTTSTIIAPTVVSTDPINLATGVLLNKIVSATFSEPMDALTITSSTFTLKDGATPVIGTINYSGSTATFTPQSNLSPNKVYTATITSGAKNPSGTALANDYVWSFTTVAAIPPTVTSTDPINLATGVALNKVIGATFSEPMDALTITTSTFTLKDGVTPVTGTINYSGNTATFTPQSDLIANKTYTATITTGAKNLAGTSIASDYVWSFTTAAAIPPTVISTDPANLGTGVALNKVITADFSTNMDQSSITTSTFTLKIGTTPVTGVVTYSGVKASFTPSANLLSGTTYTATITTGAKNLAGTSIASNYVWTFTTVAPLGPQAVDLKSVARFGIIAGVGVSNAAGFSEIRNMDVGIHPGVRSSITGFPPAIIVNGAMYASDDVAPPGVAAMLVQAKQDLTDAYLFAEGATTPAPTTVSGDQGGKTLAPGIYKSTTTLLIQSGNLTLDAQGDVNAVWIFQIASAFTTVGGAGGSIILSGGAQAKNIYWQTGSSATIGDNTSFKGNILALTSITMNSGAVAEGRMLARNGAVVMTNANIINKP